MKKFSIVVPYKQRLDNIQLTLAALADQTLDRAEFEVVVGALEHSSELTEVCASYHDRLDIVVVAADLPWNICRARNLALRQVSGQVLVVMDADMTVPTKFLANLYERYFQHGQNICVVGQMIGYEQVYRGEVNDVELLPYEHYRELLAGLEAQDKVEMDFRWTPEYASAFARFPWVYACGALVAVPASVVREHGLTYEEGFQGWGPEDQEWARRVSLTGTPIVLGEQVYGVHLPHLRSMADQSATEILNWRSYLRKWPMLDVELAIAFEQLETDRIYEEVRLEVDQSAPSDDLRLGVVRGEAGGRDLLVVGASMDRATLRPESAVRAMFDDPEQLSVLPIVGFALPWQDGAVDECVVLPPIEKLSERYRNIIRAEADRVTRDRAWPVA